MATVAEIQELYDKGDIQGAMSAVWAEVYEERPSYDPERGGLMVIRAWCHWRRQEWEDARQWLSIAEEAGGAEQRTKALRAYFAAYRDKDDAMLQFIAQELPDDVDVQNALVIRARDADSTLSHAQVGAALEHFSMQESTSVANLNHNAARFFLAKNRDVGDLNVAVTMIDRALRLYGQDRNWHHRAAATHWQSVAFERLGKKVEDAGARTQARQLWEKAVELDPNNKGFQQNLENARKREAAFVS